MEENEKGYSMNEGSVEIENTKIGYKEMLSQKQYMKIIIANIISHFGDSVDAIAFTWLVYAVTKSASWSAVIYGLNLLPSIVIQPFAGALVEKMNKKLLMILGDVLRGTAVLVLAFCYLTNQVNPFLLSIFTLFISTVEAFCLPAGTALIPKILEKRFYEYGMSLNTAASTIFQLIGTALGGILIGIWGIGMAIIIDAATFLISAFIKSTLKVPDHKSEELTARQDSYFSLLKAGFTYVKKKIVVRNFCIMALFLNAMLVPINSLQTPLVVDVLGQGSEMLSVIGIGFLIGMIVGSILYPYLSKNIKTRNVVVTIGLIFSFLFFIIPYGAYLREHSVLIYCYIGLVYCLMGGSISILSMLFNVEFMKSVDENYLARAGAIFNSCCLFASPITSFAISLFVKFIPVKEIYWVSAISCAIIFLIVQIKKVPLQEEVEDKKDASDGIQRG